jgi:hypothetical protein
MTGKNALFRSDKDLDRIIHTQFSTSFMSGQQWIRLLDLLLKNTSIIRKCRVKLIGEEEVYRELRIDEYPSYRFDYYDASMKEMVSGCSRGGYAYKEIEWMAFPLLVEETTEDHKQDIRKIYDLLLQEESFCLELNERELKVYGYK